MAGGNRSWALVRLGKADFRVLGIPMRIVFGDEDDLTVYEEGSDPLLLRRTR
jgi:hypothetical protein